MRAFCDRQVGDEIRQQTSVESASQVLAECATELGWDFAAFHADKDAIDLPRASNGRFIAALMGWPADCLTVWRAAGLGRHCPIAQLCGRQTDPFAWSCDSRDGTWFEGGFTAEQCKVLDHYGRYISSGIAVPVRLAAGSTGYVSWCSRSRDSRSRANVALGSMFYISHVFIRHVETLLGEDTAGEQLTVRERQCLSWAARGKSEKEIAAIIRRSRDTVHFHLRNAVTKLDAASRTHAVAIACTRGLISLESTKPT
jgi:DNA-binding CsgD family transcriptional regulator